MCHGLILDIPKSALETFLRKYLWQREPVCVYVCVCVCAENGIMGEAISVYLFQIP